MSLRIAFLGILASCGLLASCSRDFNVVLPAHQSQIVVECYLEAGRPLRALITESTALLDPNIVPPVVLDATVTISYDGRTDTLTPFVYLDTTRRRVYNYGSSTVIDSAGSTETVYRIDVRTPDGRHAFATTRFLKPVPVTSADIEFNDKGEAQVLTTFRDDPATVDYYQLIVRRNSQVDTIERRALLRDNIVSAAGDIATPSGYDFKSGDSVYITLFHLNEAHFNFLNTSSGARSALVNPFSASGELLSNIQGGIGLFSALTLTKREEKIP